MRFTFAVSGHKRVPSSSANTTQCRQSLSRRADALQGETRRSLRGVTGWLPLLAHRRRAAMSVLCPLLRSETGVPLISADFESANYSADVSQVRVRFRRPARPASRPSWPYTSHAGGRGRAYPHPARNRSRRAEYRHARCRWRRSSSARSWRPRLPRLMLISCAASGVAETKRAANEAATAVTRTRQPQNDVIRFCLPGGPVDWPSPVRGCRKVLCLLSAWLRRARASPRPGVRRVAAKGPRPVLRFAPRLRRLAADAEGARSSAVFGLRNAASRRCAISARL